MHIEPRRRGLTARATCTLEATTALLLGPLRFAICHSLNGFAKFTRVDLDLQL
jgi:hypothetical protein